MSSSPPAANKPAAAVATSGIPPWFRAAQPFVLGGIAGCIATSVVQPVDIVKVRLQLSGESRGQAKPPSAISMARTILQKEGPRGFYAGISAAYARQIVYGSARLGLFRTFSNWFKDLNNGGAVPAYQKVLAGIGAGALGSFIGNPTELSLIRMQADATLPPAERRNYRGIFDAVRRIVAEEGVTGLWKGSSPTVVRAMALNVAMLATSDEVKERLAPHYSARATSVISAIISGVAASVASLPFDMVRLRGWALSIVMHLLPCWPDLLVQQAHA